MRVARHLTIRGRVQGVGFRHYSTEVARREGVVGWVRNQADGCVEALVEGEVEAVARVERALRQGPRGSRVEVVLVEDALPSGAWNDFAVTR